MTNFLLYLIYSTFLLSFFFFRPINGLCSTYGVCHESHSYFNYCPAENSTKIPRALPEESRHLEERLKLKCPYLFADGNRDICCDSPQVEALFKMISIATSLFSRCPSCMDNFWKYWCMYTCSAQQDQFLKVLETEISPTSNRTMVTKVRFDLSRQYAENTYESCKDVKLASASGNAMLIMCGRLAPNETCTLEKWLNFMGTRSHPLGIPVDILHYYHDANEPNPRHFMHMNTSRCDQSPRAGQSKCMLMDCPISGKREEFILEGNANQESCKLLGLGCSLYFLLFSVVIFIGVLIWAFLPYFFQRSSKYQSSNDSASTISSQAHWIPKQIQVNSFLFVEQPCLTLMSGIFLAVICCTGLLFMIVTSNPIDVWVAPNSRAMLEKEYFDTHFGPFFRVQQVIFYPKPGKIQPVSEAIGPVFQKSFIKEVFDVINEIYQLNATLPDGRNVILEDICYRPMGTSFDCMVNSPTNYFNHNASLLNQVIIEEIPLPSLETTEDFSYDENEPTKEPITYLNHFLECIGNPYTTNTSFGQSCLGPYGGPTYPYLIFGNENSQLNVLNSTAVIISIPLSNKADILKMKAWEKSLIKFLKKYKHDDVQLSFMAERSIQDEIKRASESDAITVFIALLLMILYSIFALGKYTVDGNRLSSILIHSKILVGLCGILSIFTAIASSLGILSFYGLRIPSAAIVMNSFVTLLIGCNRIFAVVWTSKGQPEFSLPTCFKTSLPSALICTLVQSAVFFTGAFISIPAVRSFCLMSSISIFLQLFFLCVMFLPICIVDISREKKGQPEFTCCSSNAPEEIIINEKSSKLPTQKSILSSLTVKITTLTMTLIILLALPWSITKIQLGLDQKLAVPRNSYMYTHFKNIEKYLNVGPPVYFVIQGDVDFSKRQWQNKFCSLGGCFDSSVGGILSQAAANPESSYITGETLNWLDNYLEWLAPESQCCKILQGASSSYCRTNDPNCTSCDSFNANGRPTESIFYRHLNQFLEDVPGPQCVKGGRAAFQDALHLDPNGRVDSSHFMTFHVPLRNSSAFIEAMTKARLIAQKMEESFYNDNIKVFPYSVFYIYYEQFSTIRTVSAYQLIFAFTAIFLAVFLLIGFDAQLAFITTFVCCFQLICQVVFMALWDIDLNSISAVNLVLAITICVEYSLPLLLAFSSSVRKSNKLRAQEAAKAVVTSGLCGLTMPMILGTAMLTFAQSPFFNIYFFRMLIVTAVSGSFSGFLLLPVLLSLSSFFNKKRRKASELSTTALREIQETQSSLQSAPLLNTVL